MALVPRALSRLVRRYAFRRGLMGDSRFWRMVAVIVYGRSQLVRRTALTRSFRTQSRFWRTAATVIYTQNLLRSTFGKAPENLGTERLRAGQGVEIVAIPPTARRQRSRARRRAS